MTSFTQLLSKLHETMKPHWNMVFRETQVCVLKPVSQTGLWKNSLIPYEPRVLHQQLLKTYQLSSMNYYGLGPARKTVLRSEIVTATKNWPRTVHQPLWHQCSVSCNRTTLVTRQNRLQYLVVKFTPVIYFQTIKRKKIWRIIKVVNLGKTYMAISFKL